MWILASSAGPSSALIAFEKSAGMSSWQSSIVEPSLPGALARLVVKAANEVWLIGASGFVRRSSGGDPRAESVDLSFDLRALPQLPEAMLSPPGLRAIAVGDRSLRQVWVCDDQNGGLWRLAQP